MKTQAIITILVADDDEDDRAITRDAVAENGIKHPLQFVEDGEAAMDYLLQRGRFSGPGAAPPPRLILLDLNMPRKDGREVLAEMKANPSLRHIPVIVLSTSRAQDDVRRAYSAGASSYIAKPASFGELVEVIKTIGEYWLDTVVLPRQVMP